MSSLQQVRNSARLLRALVRARTVAVALLVVLASSARAQDRRPENPSDPSAPFIERIEFGWDGIVTDGRWTPITVWLGGGAKGFTGTVEIAFRQDATQDAVLSAPASATPALTTPVDVYGVLPSSPDEVQVALVNQAGQIVDAVRVSASVPLPGELPLAIKEVTQVRPVVVIGTSSLARTDLVVPRLADPGAWSDGEAPTTHLNEAAWLRQRAVVIDPGRAPRDPVAFDGVLSVVVSSVDLARMSTPARSALRDWLLSGGNVVLLASEAGASWRLILPETGDTNPIGLSDAQPVALPEDLRTLLRESQKSINTARTSSSNAEHFKFKPKPDQDDDEDPSAEVAPSSQDSSSNDASLPEVEPASQTTSRLVERTAQGVRAGWKQLFPVTPAHSLAARGPVGLGILTVIGSDPAQWQSIVSRGSLSAAWFQVLGESTSSNGGGAVTERAAFRACISDLIGSRAPSIGVLLPLWACTALLVILIGPVDALVLKRLRASQRSWATALGWCLLVSALASWFPRVIRSAPTTLDRIQVVDGKLPAPGEPSTSWTTGVTTVFGGKAGDLGLSGFAPGSWVHGFSVRQGVRFGRHSLPALRTVQATAPGETQRSGVPRELWIGQWMARSMLDMSTAASPLVARAEITDVTSPWKVRIWGLASGAQLGPAELVHAGLVRRVPEATANADGILEIQFPPESQISALDAAVSQQPQGGAAEPAMIEQLPGARDRSAAVSLLLNNENWAVARFVVRGDAGQVALTPSTGGRRWTYHRLCIPLSAPAPGETPP